MLLKDIYIRDPFILPYEGVYYMYGKQKLNLHGFCVYKSTDLVNWSEAKTVFTPPTDFWADRDFWAPEVHFYKGKFYMFASFKAEDKCRATQILVADKPDGDFVPLTNKPITPPDWECLDGTLYVDKKGKPHIVFCHEWIQIVNGTVCELELTEDLKEAVGEPRLLWSATDHPDVIKGDGYVTDGPFLHRLENGELICIWSSFNKNGYMEIISRSDNGDIDGNWTADKKPLSAEKGGHGMIFKTFDGRKMFVMHCPNNDPDERAVLHEIVENGSEISLKNIIKK